MMTAELLERLSNVRSEALELEEMGEPLCTQRDHDEAEWSDLFPDECDRCGKPRQIYGAA